MDIRTEIINNVLQALADQQQEVQERVEVGFNVPRILIKGLEVADNQEGK